MEVIHVAHRHSLRHSVYTRRHPSSAPKLTVDLSSARCTFNLMRRCYNIGEVKEFVHGFNGCMIDLIPPRKNGRSVCRGFCVFSTSVARGWGRLLVGVPRGRHEFCQSDPCNCVVQALVPMYAGV